MNAWDIIVQYRAAIVNGLGVTLHLCLYVWSIGLVAGTLLGALGGGQKGVFRSVVSTGAFILSGLPTLVLLYWLHYPAQALLEVVIPPFFTTVLALSVVNIFVVARQVQIALLEFPRQYVVAAIVAGMSSRQTLRHIKFPILLRQLIPSLLTAQVNMLQLTLFASLISVDEIFRVAQQINSQIYKPVEIYTLLGLFFLMICLPLNALAIALKSRYTRNLSES